MTKRQLTQDRSSESSAQRYGLHMSRVGLVCLAFLGSAAHSQTVTLPSTAAWRITPSVPHRLNVADAGAQRESAFVVIDAPKRQEKSEAAQLHLDQGGVVPSATPVELRLEPLAGHLSFAALEDGTLPAGFSLTVNNNMLGVGLTETYRTHISDQVAVAPFAALDYNRVDSDRLLNAHSPRPFSADNADTGFTITLGVTARPLASQKARVQPMAFAAAVIGSDNVQLVREAGSIASQIVQSIGSSGPEVVWSEVGTGADYHVTSASFIRASVVQTIGRPTGDQLAAQLSLRAHW